MSAAVIPMPGLAIHIWPARGGWFGVETVRGSVDPDFPPEGAPLFEDYTAALDEAFSRRERNGLPIITHVEGE